MKRMLVLFTLALVATAQGATALAATARAATQIKLGTPAPSGTSFHTALQQMGEQWRKASNGSIEVIIYPDGNMGPEAELVKRMRSGQLHAALLTVIGLAEIDPGVTALQEMPMTFRDLAEVDYVREQMQPMLAQRLRSKGYVVLLWADAGWIRFFSRQRSVTPSDFRKQKLFTVAGDTQQADLMQKLGYQPVPLEFSDALIGLQTGMVDAVPDAPFHALAAQFYRVTKHMTEVNWAPLVGALVVRSETWDALPAATQLAFARAAGEAGKAIQAHGRSESDLAVAAMVKRGLVVHQLTPEAQAEWERVARTAWPQIRGKRVPADVFDEVHHLLEVRRKAQQAVGR